MQKIRDSGKNVYFDKRSHPERVSQAGFFGEIVYFIDF